MRIIDYELIENVSILYKSKIIIYGAGYWADQTYNCMIEAGIYPVMVCQTKVTDKKFHDLEIRPILSLLDQYDSDQYLLVVASIDYYKEMVEMCTRFKAIQICTLYGFYTSIKLHTDEKIFPKEFNDKIEAGKSIGQYNFFQTLKLYAENQFVDAALAPEDRIWIFQPGKVGSQSIWNSIQNKSLQFHSLTVAGRFTDIDKKYFDYYLHSIQRKNLKIISAVREPISRDIAAFFQNSDLQFWPFHHFNNNIFWLYGDIENSEMNLEKQALQKRCPVWRESLNCSFEELAYAIVNYKSDIFSWFDYEIKKVFGIDIYDFPFDKKKGYTIIKKNNIELLILKMENLSRLENVIGEFIDETEYKLINRNRASDKIYRYAYEGFKENIKIPYEYFRYYYDGNCKYEHFYTEDEIKTNREYWRRYVSKE